MFFLKYLRRELRRRLRQVIVIAVGLALGIGLVIVVTALSSGVKGAQGKVLQSLYGVGTDITVTTAPTDSGPGIHPGQVTPEPYVQHFDTLASDTLGPLKASTVGLISSLPNVSSTSGSLLLTETKSTVPAQGAPPSGFQFPTLTTVVGVDLTHSGQGPLSSGKILAGRTFDTAQGQANVALVDSAYAATHGVKVGSSVAISGTSFKVIGLVNQTQETNPPNVYIPLPRAQALAKLDGYVNTVYVQAKSAADVGTVTGEITKLMPSATVTNTATLANQVTGSLATTANLATKLGTWLAILALIAAFALASLLTIAAVSRRVREFGTLKALGWRSKRITLQVIGESVAIGIAGAALGVALGFGGTALASTAAPKLSATVTQQAGAGASGSPCAASGAGAGCFFSGQVGGPMQTVTNPNATHTVDIPFNAPVTLFVIVVAVILAIAGGLIAGSFGGWRIARLRPATALARPE